MIAVLLLVIICLMIGSPWPLIVVAVLWLLAVLCGD